MNQIDWSHTSTVFMQANSPPTAAFNGGNASELSFKALRVLSPLKTIAPPALTFWRFVSSVSDGTDQPTSIIYGIDISRELVCKGCC
jgi:hypothetical protein